MDSNRLVTKITIIFKVLSSKLKIKYGLAILVSLLSSFFELVTLIIIVPFITFINEGKFSEIGLTFVARNTDDKLYFLFFVIGVFIITASIKIINLRINSTVVANLSYELYNYIYTDYLYKNYIEKKSINSSDLTATIANKIQLISVPVFMSILNLFSNVILLISLLIMFFLKSPIVSGLLFLFALLLYGLNYFLIRKKLVNISYVMSRVYNNIYQILDESTNDFKSILLRQKEKKFLDRYNNEQVRLKSANIDNQFYANLPKLYIEPFFILLALTIFTFLSFEKSLNDVLPGIVFFLFGSQKLIPAFQQVFYSLSSIISSKDIIDEVSAKCKGGLLQNISSPTKNNSSHEKFQFNSIEFKDVSFSYDQFQVIKGLSFRIEKGDSVLFLGNSGSGKSTTVDLLMGLIKPQSGYIKVNDSKNLNDVVLNFQEVISYMDQSIFIRRGTIRDFILDYRDNNEIYIERLNKVLSIVNLNVVISASESLVNIDEEQVENGKALSGGQRQRVALARVLFTDHEILILDEPTSALNEVMAFDVMQNIIRYCKDNERTLIVISHNLSFKDFFDKVISI